MESISQENSENHELIGLTAKVVAAYAGANALAAEQLPDLLKTVHQTLSDLQKNRGHISLTSSKPAVSIKQSIKPDYLVCLEDGKQLKMLKRYLRTKYQMSPGEYRRKWGLPEDYPMVAPNYSKKRSRLARNIGLGRKPEDD